MKQIIKDLISHAEYELHDFIDTMKKRYRSPKTAKYIVLIGLTINIISTLELSKFLFILFIVTLWLENYHRPDWREWQRNKLKKKAWRKENE